MSMPLFTAAASIYKSGHYWTSGAFGEASEIVGHEFFAPLNRTCGVCYLDENSACVRDCTNCPPGQPPNGCTEFTLTCRPDQCCPSGQERCASGSAVICCPAGQRCCDPARHLCCPGDCCGANCCPGAGIRWTNYPDLSTTPRVYKWLVVQCQLADVPSIPPGLDLDISQFLGQGGTGYGNIVDYYHDVSYNAAAFQADFVGWVAAPFKLADTTDPSTPVGGSTNRAERVRQCLQAIPVDEVPDFGRYYGVIAIGNASSEAGACHIGQQAMTINNKTYNLACAYFDPNSLFTAFAAHEIGHGFGLTHSFDNSQNTCGSSTPGEYCDPWDIMSALATFQFRDPNWLIGGQSASGGPGMSTPNLLRMSWLLPANLRVFQPDGGEQTFTIRALSHPQSGQPLVVVLPLGRPGPFPSPFDGSYTVEYRQGDGWDLGFVSNFSAPQTVRSQEGAVLIHQYRLTGDPPATPNRERQ